MPWRGILALATTSGRRPVFDGFRRYLLFIVVDQEGSVLQVVSDAESA
jgi:hypothetical protein